MKIALLGFGTVGGGVLDLLSARSDLSVRYILSRRNPGLSTVAFTRDITTILHDPEVDLVVEALGGLEPAYDYVLRALQAGKHVVTANKQLVAAHYATLLREAQAHGVGFRCTAAVGGGIPWLVNLERVKRFDTILSVGGILNGTTNFILDAMHRRDCDFAEVLAQAQALGYAEADPSADIDGLDIQRKLAISASVALDAAIPPETIPTFGIRNVRRCDIAAAKAMNASCRLLASAQRTGNALCAYVEPTFVPDSQLAANVPTNHNLISLVGARLGAQSFFGQGAGRYPTAMNVVQDCLDIAGGVRRFYAEAVNRLPLCGDRIARRYYLRTSCPDVLTPEEYERPLGEGFLTRPIPVSRMHEAASVARSQDPALFFAGISDEEGA